MGSTTFGKPIDTEVAALNSKITNLIIDPNITRSSGWTENRTNCRKIGNIVFVNIYVEGTPSNNKEIATGLPTPANVKYSKTALGSSPSYITVDANGVLKIISAGTGTLIGGALMYVAS